MRSVRVCLQVGSTVEVKTNEGLSSEAVIGKLTDASLYTVGELLLLTCHTRVIWKRATVSESLDHMWFADKWYRSWLVR